MKALLQPAHSQKLAFFSALYFAISLAFQTDWLPPTLGIIGLSAAWFFNFNFITKLKHYLGSPRALALSSLFLIPLIWMVFSSNPSEGWRKVGLSSTLIVFPLIFSSLKKPLSNVQIRWVLWGFVAAMVLSSGYLSFRSIHHYSTHEVLLMHHDFAAYPRISVHYFALYQLFALFSLLHLMLSPARRLSPIVKVLGILSGLILITGMFLAAARMQLLLLLLLSVFFSFWHFRKRIGSWKLIGIQGIVVLLLAGVAWSIPSSQKRIREAYREVQAFGQSDSRYQTNHRVFIWKYAAQVISENFLLGTGTGSADDALYEGLKTEEARFWTSKEEFYTLARKKYNYHNAYLQHFAAYGVMGLLAIFSVWILALANSRRNFPLALLLICCGFSFLTESMLERQAGVLFFAFFYCLLAVVKPSSAPQTSD